MKITCQSCQSKYTVSDEKVQGKTVKIKCRKCGATILVNSGGVTTTGAGPEVDAVSGSTESGPTFQVNVTEGDQRSMTLPEIVAAYNTSMIAPDTYVWTDGMGDWQPLAQVEIIVAALHNPAFVAAAGQSPFAAGQSPFAAGQSPFAAAPAAMQAQAPAPAYAAPPESAPETAPRAAARRDPSRRSQDLFSGGVGQQVVEEPVATSAPLYNGSPPGAPSGSSGGGKRDDNSILFSLSALTSKVATSTSGSAGGRSDAKLDDSGLIDLKALANAPGAASSGTTDFMGDHVGLFPLGAPSVAAPIAAAPVAVSTAPAAPSKTPIFIGVGIAVASLAILGVFFATKGGGDKPPIAESAQQAAPPPPVVTTEPAPVATPSVTAEASSAPSATAVARPSRPFTRGGGGVVKGSTGGGSPPPATAAPAPPKRDKCGCAAGDLMCAMKCSAK